MVDEDSFRRLMQRVFDGDEEAAAALVRDYESVIRREVRMQLRDARLRRLLDTMDICQSVLAGFFARAAAGELHLDESAQLVRLLVAMTRNKLASQARRQTRQRRDHRRVTVDDAALDAIDDGRESPSRELSKRELLERVGAAFTDEERRIAALREGGHSWDAIATELGGTAQARRMQFARALERVERTFRERGETP